MEFLLTGNQENMKYMNKLKTGHSDFKCLLHVFHDFMFSCFPVKILPHSQVTELFEKPVPKGSPAQAGAFSVSLPADRRSAQEIPSSPDACPIALNPLRFPLTP